MDSLQRRLVVFKRFTEDLASLSKCKERKTAAIITDSKLNTVLSIGVNGGPAGLQDCMCGGRYGCVHAEVNALVKLTSGEPNKIMLVTLSPCISCAAAIINTPGGFSRVYYFEEWKDTSGITLLINSGIVTCPI